MSERLEIRVGAFHYDRQSDIMKDKGGVVPVVLSIEVKDKDEDIKFFNEILGLAKKLEAERKAPYWIMTMGKDTNSIRIGFDKLDTVRPFLDKLRGHDLVTLGVNEFPQNIFDLCKIEKFSLHQLIDKINDELVDWYGLNRGR